MLKTWLPVLTGMCCLGLGPGVMAVYGFFVEPLSQEFGVGVAVLNTGPVALLLVPAFLGALIGKLADRLPVRNIMLAGASLAMFSLIGIGQAPTLVWVAVGFLSFSLGLSMYGPVVINGMMVKLYPGREARALALAAIGISVAAIILPPLVGSLLAHFDWRMALQLLAAGLLLLLWLLILAGTPRGVVGAPPSGKAAVAESIYSNKPFWLIGLCVALGLNVMIVLSVADTGWVLSIGGAAGLAGKSCLAWFGDVVRHSAKWLAVGLLSMQVVGLCLLYVAGSLPEVLAAFALLGFANGAFIPMHPYLNSRYFDAAIISQVNGAQMPLFLPFGLIGAPLAGYVYDKTGSYDVVMIALAVTLAIAALMILPLPRALK
jgi:predicted MFS family arabinose efflux permease